jgi:exopolysaccharide biosynthesis polyprenyl glycosylphosphotransferase
LFTVLGMLSTRVVIWHLAVADPKRIGIYLSEPRRHLLRNLMQRHQGVPIVTAEKRDDNPQEVALHFQKAGVSEIIVSSAERSDHDQAVWLCCLSRGLQVTDLSTFVERQYYRVPCQGIDLSWLLLVDLRWNHPFYHRFKRIIDLLFAAGGLVLAFPVLLLAAICIRIESRGSVLYSQVRVGFLNRPYRIWKLRTMRTDAEADGPQWAAKGDTRVTQVGKLLRRTRIDELPQLWNVVCGEMSLIGPRPERPEFVEKLAREIPLFPQRHWIKPGISGWAQINYPYGASVEDAREKLSFDLYYLKNATPLLDIQIALRTIGAVMKGSR